MKENLCKKCNFYTADPDSGICDACLEMSYFDDEEKINCVSSPIDKILGLTNTSEVPLEMIYEVAIQHRFGNFELSDQQINCLLQIGTNLNKDFCKNKFTEELIGEVFKKEKENETYN